MSEPPALPEPIKPPRGEFSLEERKWREGITRALNILTEDIANIDSLITKGELSGDGYIEVTNGANAVLGSGTSLSFDDTSLAKLDEDNTFSGRNTFAEIICGSITPVTSAENVGSSDNAWDHVYTNSIGSNTDTLYLFGNGGALATNFYCCPSITATNRYLGDSSHKWTEAFIDKINVAAGSTKGVYFGSNTFVRDVNGNSLALSSTVAVNLQLSGTTVVQMLSDRLIPAGQNNTACGAPNNRWSNVYTTAIHLGAGDASIANNRENNDLMFTWKYGTSYRQISGYHDHFFPEVSNLINLGTSDNRWKTIWTNATTINSSDRRVKANIEPLENALEKLNSIGVKSYTMEGHDDYILYGFIAQDELERNPELIYVPENYNEEDENSGILGAVSGNVTYLAVKAIQELSNKVTELEEEYGNLIKNR